MPALSDLTAAELATAYNTLCGLPTGRRTFSSKSKAVARLYALLAERDLTVADALRAAGHDPEATDETRDPAPEETAEDAPVTATGTEEEAVEQEADAGIAAVEHTEDIDAPVGDITDAEGDETIPASAEADDAPYNPPDVEPGTTIADTAPALFRDPATRLAALEGLRDGLVAAGHDDVLALLAADWIDLLIDRAFAIPVAPTRTPRTGTKQDAVLALLRHPKGATLNEIAAATGWQHHSIRGFFAGALKKKLGLTVTSEKVAGGARIYRLADGQ